MRSVTFTAIEGIPLVNQGDNLGGLICSAMAASGLIAARGDILVVCQKVISKAEGRTCELTDIIMADETRSARLAGVVLRALEV